MILGARESWWSLLYNESKNIEILRVLFAGDDFEKIFLKIKCSNLVDLICIGKAIEINEMIAISVGLSMKS